MKLAKRGRKQWNDRYFRLTGNSLSYHHNKDDAAKSTFPITVGQCVVGNLYMDQKQRGTKKEILYCFRISFERDTDDASTILPNETANGGQPLSPNRSLSGRGVLSDDEDELTTNGVGNQESVPPPDKSIFRRKPKMKRKNSITDDEEVIAPSPKPGWSKRRTLATSSRDESLQPEQAQPLMPSTWTPVDPETSLVPNIDDDINRPVSYSYMQQQQRQEQQFLQTHFREAQREYKKRTRKKIVDGGKLAVAAGAAITVGILTAGVGLVAGLAFLGAGAAAGGTGVVGGAAYQRMSKKSGLVVASTSYEEARLWKSALDACLVSQTVKESTWGQLFVMDGRSAKTALLPTEITTVRSTTSDMGDVTPRALSFRLEESHRAASMAFVEPDARWQPMEGGWATLLGTGTQGLRIFREERHASARGGKLSVKEIACPPLKAHAVLNASPLQAFLCLMSLARVGTSNHPMRPGSEQRASFRIVERMDDHTDVIHLFFRPLYLFPSWTTPRDFVLFRYWRYEPDGSYVICVDSIKHKDCPPQPGFTRGDMHGVYTIAPKKKSRGEQDSNRMDDCLLTSVVQVDPCGWIPRSFMSTYSEAFGVSALLQMLDIKDALDHERFLQVPLDSTSHAVPPPYRRPYPSLGKSPTQDEEDPFNYDFSYSTHEASNEATGQWIESHPPPLDLDRWAEPDANSFRVRGKTYKKDKIKINAGSSIGKLIAVDVVKVDEPIYTGFSIHPRERIKLALEREKRLQTKGVESGAPPFVFLVNIILPGPPCYHAAYYYAIDDMSSIDGSDGTPSSKLFQKFIFGDDDDFRDRTFKLIPTIVEGNFVVRKAVGSTPAIMGTKLKQYYIKTERSFEVVLDCGSSSVATGVIRLCLGYAKTLVVDMGFLLEGNDESTLPERIFGCARMKQLDFGEPLRKVVPIDKTKTKRQAPPQ